MSFHTQQGSPEGLLFALWKLTHNPSPVNKYIFPSCLSTNRTCHSDIRVTWVQPVCVYNLEYPFKTALCIFCSVYKFITVSIPIKTSIIKSRFWLNCYDFRYILGIINIHVLRLPFCYMKFETNCKINNTSSDYLLSERKQIQFSLPWRNTLLQVLWCSHCLLEKSCTAKHFTVHFTGCVFT